MQKAIAIVIGLCIGGALVVGRFVHLAEVGSEARDVVASYCKHMPSYATDSAYIDDLLEATHEVAFDRHDDLGGRRRAASFDTEAYFFDMFTDMAQQAKADGKEQLSDDLWGALMQLKLNQARAAREGTG